MSARILVALAALAFCTPAIAAPPPDPIATAQQALSAGDYAKAAAAWHEAAEKQPNLPELIYNEGVALYRGKDYVRAAEQFSRALASGQAALEARTKFNLGNCEYAQAVEKGVQPQQVEEHLKTAIRHYRDALAAGPADADARANIELASRLLKAMQEQKQQSSQPNEDQQDQQNPSSQPNKDKNKGKPSSRPSSQNSQPSSQPDQQQQPASQPDQQQSQKPQPQSQPAAQSQPAQPAEARKMSKEEAERMLQLIRDKERQRREEKLRQQRVRRVPVEKDW